MKFSNLHAVVGNYTGSCMQFLLAFSFSSLQEATLKETEETRKLISEVRRRQNSSDVSGGGIN